MDYPHGRKLVSRRRIRYTAIERRKRCTCVNSLPSAEDDLLTAPPATRRGAANLRRLLWLALKLAVMALILAAVFHRVDPTALGDVLRTASPGWIAAAVFVFMLSSVMGGLRWWCLLRA